MNKFCGRLIRVTCVGIIVWLSVFTAAGVEPNLWDLARSSASTHWNIIACYTDLPTQARIESIFEFTAGLFDEIMIDDFWFTDCACAECDTARRSRKVTIGERVYDVSGDSWEDYRAELMVRLSRDRVLAASKRINPQARLIECPDAGGQRGSQVAS